MEHLEPDESLTIQLSRLHLTLGKLQDEGEDGAFNRSMHVHSWLEKYVKEFPPSVMETNDIIISLFRFYNPENMSLADWQDKVALIPLELLVSYGYPSWDDVTPGHIEKCFEIAENKGSERHSKECFLTGDDNGCFVSTKCPAKAVSQLGLDLATGLTALEVVSAHSHDNVAKKRALEGIKVIGSMLVKAKMITEEEYEEFLDVQHHNMSLSLRPDMFN